MGENQSEETLTKEELQRAARITVWLVWYEDQFQAGPGRDAADLVAVYADEDAARNDHRVRRRPLTPGWDGYSVDDCNLWRGVDRGLIDATTARRLLAESEAKEES
jgi:hypothetical protein